MKKYVIVYCIILTQSAVSQSSYEKVKTIETRATQNEQEYIIYSSEYKEAKNRTERLIQENNFIVIKQEETKTSLHYEFNIPTVRIPFIDSFASTLGYVSSKQLTSFNNEMKLDETKLDLEFLQDKKREYELMLIKIDSAKSDKYYLHWEKTREIENEIAITKKKIKQLEYISPIHKIKIEIIDEQVNLTNTKISFINMPGVEYSYLFIEKPKSGISYPNYNGLLLKYLFTKGKSFFSLGVLKGQNTNNTYSDKDSLSYAEFFNFAFGQDFYSKRFGRGSKKFLNLYVGYEVGAALSFNNQSSKTIPFVNPGIGIELFKNKNILIDTNVHYFLPLSEELNQNLRGWKAGLSFNFVF